MSSTTTPILVWKYETQGRPRFAVGEPPEGVAATLIHRDNYADLFESDARVGGCSFRLFNEEEEARKFVEKAKSYGDTELDADYTILPCGDAVTLMHGSDLKKGFHSAVRTGRFDLRGSWGMTPDEIQAVAPNAIEISPSPDMRRP
jgi:hypothetical protein